MKVEDLPITENQAVNAIRELVAAGYYDIRIDVYRNGKRVYSQINGDVSDDEILDMNIDEKMAGNITAYAVMTICYRMRRLG